MIDGITIIYLIENFEEWKRSVNISFGITIDIDTAEIKTKKRYEYITTTHRGKWETFYLVVKEVLNITTGKKTFRLKIKGSLHKNHYNSKNYLPFTWQQLQEQINHLCISLSINPTRAQISTLEIGVNIVTPFEVMPFLMNSIINYKGNSFNRYKTDNNGFCLGIHISLSQYEIKIYDKGLQNDLSQNLMRFEKRFLKMQSLNDKGIKFLSDLQTLTKVNNLQGIFLQAWDDVLIYDIPGSVKILTLKLGEIDLLSNGKNSKFWEGIKETKTGDQYKYQKNKFKKLVEKYGNNWQTVVNDLLKTEWENLFKNYPNLPTGQNHLLPEFTIKIKGKNGEKVFTPQKRYCLSCGKELDPTQKINSNFCSAKYVGELAAHRCRNNDSNPRNNFKNKIKKITKRGLLFDIMPFIDKKKLNLP